MQLICENGDIIESSSTYCDMKYCEKCSAPVISACPQCGTPIRGHEEGVSGYYHIPSYCRECGSPYPWTEKAIQSAACLLAEDENITAEECNRLIEILPDAMTETPRTNLAAVRIRKALKILGTFAADGLRQFVLDYGCDLLKNLI